MAYTIPKLCHQTHNGDKVSRLREHGQLYRVLTISQVESTPRPVWSQLPEGYH